MSFSRANSVVTKIKTHCRAVCAIASKNFVAIRGGTGHVWFGMGKISAEDSREVFRLLDTALELPVTARAAWLDTLVQASRITNTLRELLARQTADRFLRDLPQFTGSPDLPRDDSATDTAEIGTTVGPYRLTGRLGRGGMSSVWIAERIDGLLKRRVALKLPHVSWAMPEAARRMARERDLLASLEHPNIARLYDAGIGAMAGRTLRSSSSMACRSMILRRSQRRQRHARAPGVADRQGSRYAHSRSIVHRDLKPSNILVDAAGQVRLLDFGIGKLLESDAPAPGNETQFGGRLFTPDYASPEQSAAKPSRPAPTCSRSAGALSFSARAAFPARSGDRQRSRRAAPRALRGDLDTIVQKALKESARERYPSMAAFAQDLERYLRGEPVLARPDTRGTGCASSRPESSHAARRQRLGRRHGRDRHRIVDYLSREHSASTARALELSADAISERALPRTMPTRSHCLPRVSQARSLMLRPTEENLREIVRFTESAITRDPNFGHAHSLLGGVNVLYMDIGYPRANALDPWRGSGPARTRADSRSPRPVCDARQHRRAPWPVDSSRGRSSDARLHWTIKSGRVHARHAQTVLRVGGTAERRARGIPGGIPPHAFARARRHADGHDAQSCCPGMTRKH